MHQPSRNRSDVRYLRCLAGGATFCAPLAEVQALRGREHFALNREGRHPAGWVKTASGTVPALSLAALLGLPAAEAGESVFLVFGQGADAWALGVDSIARPFAAPAAGSELPLLEGRAISPFFSATAWDGERLLLVLQSDRLRHRAGEAADMPRITAWHDADSAALRRGAADAAPTQKLLLFSTPPAAARSVLFALCLIQVSEVLRSSPVWPLPGAAPHVLGFTARNRLPVPVVDLGLRLGFGAAPSTGPQRLLLVRSRDGAAHVGITARADLRLQELASGQRAVAPGSDLGATDGDAAALDTAALNTAALDATLTRAVFVFADHTLVLPDIGRLIQSQLQSRSWLDASSLPSQRALAQKGLTP